MNKRKRFFILLTAVLMLASGCKKSMEVKTIEINKRWQFRQVGKEQWHKAAVPGLKPCLALKTPLVSFYFVSSLLLLVCLPV